MNAYHRDAKLPPNGSLPCEAGEGWGGGVKTPRSDKFTYTFPATLYVNVGWGLPHRADATAGTTARTFAGLPHPPVGLEQLARSATSICSRNERKGRGLPTKNAAAFFVGTRGGVCLHTALPDSQPAARHAVTVRQGAPCRALPVRESRGGVRPHTALPNSQSAPCPAFTYTLPAILYVKGATCHAMP